MIGLDFETYSSRDLTKVGLQNYVDDPNFQPLVAVVATHNTHYVFDFVSDGMYETTESLKNMLLTDTGRGHRIAAHNAEFERRVLRAIGIDLPVQNFVDTAVVAAYHGAGRSLEAAAAQLLNKDKYAAGKNLIKTFCIPGPYQDPVGAGSQAFNPDIRKDLEDDWAELITYCALDAELSFLLAELYLPVNEHEYSWLTMEMNSTGWPIDLELVEEMQNRYDNNVAEVKSEMIDKFGSDAPNLNSTTQLKKWCTARGIRSSSFDEDRVADMLVLMDKKLMVSLPDDKRVNYEEVETMLKLKQQMGGSSLKKLEAMERQAASSGRLYDSYLHFGAQATGRTTGRGVQMQNLPRLFGEGDDVDDLFQYGTEWDNAKLARNLRQVFRASHPQGKLIVGDFSSVESRGLAWQANEGWKLQAYQSGTDLYKVLASRIYDAPYDSVSKTGRQVGKVGELSCGYGAGPGAVQAFAKNMGVTMSEVEAASLVRDWRAANPNIVGWWQQLQDALLTAMHIGDARIPKGWGSVSIVKTDAPQSLRDMGPQHSLEIKFDAPGLSFKRCIHGVEVQGRNLTYYKPSERKTGDLWSNHFTDPKTKQTRQFTVYGGKLAGLLTQSLCREMFFQSLLELHKQIKPLRNAKIIGQFHDEIVVEWQPGSVTESTVKAMMEQAMTFTPLKGFPLGADIKSAYRYIK